VGLWGLHLGLTQGLLAALVADTCPKEYRGTAFGIFNLLSAIALLISNLSAGFLWDHFGVEVTFMSSAAVTLVGLTLFLVLMRRVKI
jgi:MFS family permease